MKADTCRLCKGNNQDVPCAYSTEVSGCLRYQDLQSRLAGALDQATILRRIAERGKVQARRLGQDIDIWQHLLDEIERLKLEETK